jgi:autotransporter-associated beta strand protein
VALRANGLTITTAQGTVSGGIDLSISGNITDSGGNTLTKSGNGTLSLSGVNTFNGDITISAGKLRMDGAGRLNSGNYTAQIHNNGTDFSFNSSAAQTLGVISGSGTVTLNGSGTLTLNSVNTDTNQTIVNAGVLAGVGTIAGAVTVNAGGTLAPGSAGAGAFTVSGNLALQPGSTSTFSVNGSTPANTTVALGGGVTYGGLLNVLPSGTFTAGQSFTLFSGAGAVSASNFSSILGTPGSGLGFAFTNGVLKVVANGPTGPGRLTNSVSGNVLSLSWPAGQGWRLQIQTNGLFTGLSPNWVYVTDGTVNSTNITINPSTPTAFYRLTYP